MGTILTGPGKDRVEGTSTAGDGIELNNGAKAILGGANDAMIGTGSSDGIGLDNGSEISTGAGNDTVTGNGATDTGIELDDGSRINTGAGNDRVTGTGESNGINLDDGSELNTSSGNDRISGSSTNTSSSSTGIDNDDASRILTGAGNDQVRGMAMSSISTALGIDNAIASVITTGAGNDRVTGSATNTGGGMAIGILNDGLIDTGNGRDQVNALQGGFVGSGFTAMGKGNDVLSGFGSGNFDGGAGKKDTIRLGAGTYAIDRTAGTIISGAVTMNVQRFERFGGSRGRTFSFQTGTLIVNALGNGVLI